MLNFCKSCSKQKFQCYQEYSPTVRIPTVSRDQIQKNQTHTKNKNLKKHRKKWKTNSSATPSSSLPQAAFQGRFWRPAGAATYTSCKHIIPSWHGWYVCIMLAILACPQTTNKQKKTWKLWSLLRLQRSIQVLGFFICLNQTTRFTFSQCRSPCFTYILLESITNTSRRTVFRACRCMILLEKHLLWTTEKRGNSHGFVTLQFEKTLWNLRNYNGQKKTSLKHGYLHGIVTCPYFLGPENGVRFLRRFSFRCSIGYIFVALFVKSSFGTFLLWSCTSQGTRHFQTSIVIDDNTSWSHWTQVTSQVWTCVKYVPKPSIP